jgi:hypothetical protein
MTQAFVFEQSVLHLLKGCGVFHPGVTPDIELDIPGIISSPGKEPILLHE